MFQESVPPWLAVVVIVAVGLYLAWERRGMWKRWIGVDREEMVEETYSRDGD